MSTDWPITLPDGLAQPGMYAVESNQALAGTVQAALKGDVGADVRPVLELTGLQAREDVPPLDLLLGLGRLTSALPGLHRIGSGGMPGLTALRTASRWAVIRYLWAFADHRPDLRLSDLTNEVRSHQRTLLSESFGLALAADLIERYVLPGATRVVDADAVDYDPVLAVDMAALASHKPDYFWYRVDGDRLTDVVVVEVKGTTSGRRRCIEQMARGVEQVLVPARIRGVAMRRIVVGTELHNGKLKACAAATRLCRPLIVANAVLPPIPPRHQIWALEFAKLTRYDLGKLSHAALPSPVLLASGFLGWMEGLPVSLLARYRCPTPRE